MCNIVICGKMSRPSLSAPAGGGGAAASSDMWTAAAAARRHRSTGDWICHLQSSSPSRQSCEWRRDVNLQLCNSLIILVDRHTRRHVMWYTHCFDNAGYLVTEWMVWFEWCTIFMKSRSTLEWHIGVIHKRHKKHDTVSDSRWNSPEYWQYFALVLYSQSTPKAR